MVEDCHHSLCLYGDRMKLSLPKKTFFFFFGGGGGGESPTSPWVLFRTKFRLLGPLFHPSRPLAYSLKRLASEHNTATLRAVSQHGYMTKTNTKK